MTMGSREGRDIRQCFSFMFEVIAALDEERAIELKVVRVLFIKFYMLKNQYSVFRSIVFPLFVYSHSLSLAHTHNLLSLSLANSSNIIHFESAQQMFYIFLLFCFPFFSGENKNENGKKKFLCIAEKKGAKVRAAFAGCFSEGAGKGNKVWKRENNGENF